PFVIGGPDPEGFPSAIRLGVPDVQNLANRPGAALAEERPSKPMQPLLEPLEVVRSRPITRAESKLRSALVEPEVCQLRFAQSGRARLRMSPNPGWGSVDEPAMTRRISLVAVCCSRACASRFNASARR